MFGPGGQVDDGVVQVGSSELTVGQEEIKDGDESGSPKVVHQIIYPGRQSSS